MRTKKSIEAARAFQDLVELMDTLREKCPWDAKQTISSLQKYTLEETYELMDAINEGNMAEIKEELGDILFHTIFYSKIAQETNHFSITDVIHTVHNKLVNRHPHIFGDVVVKDEVEVKVNWEKLKLKEGKESVLSGVPVSLPAMVKAFRIQEKAKQVGFEWENALQVWDKVEEEISEFKEEISANNKIAAEEEFGDVLFSLINYARFVDIDPESALARTNTKFIKRFKYIEQQAKAQNKDLEKMNLDEMEALWQQAKE